MPRPHLLNMPLCLAFLILGPIFVGATVTASAQTFTEIQTWDREAAQLLKEGKYVQALPVLERLAISKPDDAQVQWNLGFALLAKSRTSTFDWDQRDLRVNARKAFVRSKELGNTEAVLPALIQSLPPDGSPGPGFSPNEAANAMMNAAEASFSSGNLDDAFKKYQAGLKLDPTIYEAALYSGDVFLRKEEYAQAEIWYQRAIAINPNRETAYRYSATPLMKQRRFDQARDRYIEAYISEPYSRFSVAGITNWAKATNTSMSHPQIDIPTKVTFAENGDVKVDLDVSLLSGKDDGSFAWIAYGATRSSWRKEKFAKAYPREKAYRHSLAEEADALRSVLLIATTDKKVKTLNPTLAKLKKLDEDGVLEAYLLIARPDEGIAQDHAAYLNSNRDKLRQYVVKYVVTNGGNW
ncbi:MAG: tetratricopeptide repeat protein [Pyrinomonadaceae bacterium]